MQLPIQININSDLSLQTQIFEEIRHLILNGSLPPATRIPATRELSAQLNVSRNTVSIVYERLIAEGYIETRRGSGTFVSTELPERTLASRVSRKNNRKAEKTYHYHGNFSAQKPTLFFEGDDQLTIDFRVGRPDNSLFPIKLWRSLAIKELKKKNHQLTSYNDPCGLPDLRKALTSHLRMTRGIQVKPEQVIIVAGVQEALNLISRVLITPKTEVVIESPTYQGAAFTFNSYGAKLIPIKVDENGLKIERLPPHGARLTYVTPSHQFPLGYTLSLERRLLLLEWADRTGSYIIEDDYDSDFRYQSSPLTALQGLDEHERVIYTSTFSKSLGAGIRLGYVIVPPHLIDAIGTAKALLNNGHPWLEQMILTAFLNSGGFENHLRKIRKVCLQRRDTLLHAIEKHFPESRFSGLEGGMHLVWYLPDSLPDASTLQQMMRERGIGIYSLTLGHAHEFGDMKDRDRVILLGYASLSEYSIKEGINAIAKTFGQN